MSEKFTTRQQLIDRARSAIGKSIGDYDENYELQSKKSKGNVGHVLEKGLFGYSPNNESGPDFPELGVELKVTGYRWVYNGTKVSAKERLVISMIGFFSVVHDSFYESLLFSKMRKMLIILYEYEQNKDPYEFKVTNVYPYDFDLIPDKDKLIIENDFNTIIEKIKDGKAHELSEGDTFYLGACPKGSNRSDVTNQPYSDIPAMRRAFSLKTTYMTSLLRNNVFENVDSRESFIKDINQLKEKPLQEIIRDSFEPFFGKSLTEIDALFNIHVNREAKGYLRTYVSRMINVNPRNLDSIEEFEKSNIVIKTIRVRKSGSIKESMSFPAFSFIEVAKEKWDESTVKDMFESTKFLFVVFDEINDTKKEYNFRGIKLWNMPINLIEEEVFRVWDKTQKILNSEIKLKISSNRILNNFPASSENSVTHVRPHGRNRRDTNPLPATTSLNIVSDDGSVSAELNSFIVNHEFSKLSFWLNNSFVKSLIKDV